MTVTEANGGTVNAIFTVSLSNASGQTVSVAYATADGTAVAAPTTPRRAARSSSRPGS